MTTIPEYELVVVGAGSAGFAAVQTGLQLGKKVAVIEKGPFGGLCILRGCMPSKTLLRTAQIAKDIKDGPQFGVMTESTQICPDIYIARKNRIIQEFAEYRNKALYSTNVDVYEGVAKYLDGHTIQVGKQRIHFQKNIIATGSVEFIPDVPGLSEVDFLTSDDVLELQTLPQSILILGGGAIALEMASYFSAVGTDVTLVQRSAQVLSREDADVAHSLENAMREEGIRLYTSTRLNAVRRISDGVEVDFSHTVDGSSTEPKATASSLMLALGRAPDVASLDCESAGVMCDARWPIVNEFLETTNPDILVAGDASGILQVVNVAIAQGEVAAHNAFHADKKTVDYWRFPKAVFCTPEFATVGRTERELDEAGTDYRVATYPFADEGKAICIGETHGLLKIIFGIEDRKILGVSIVGAHASELIHEGAALLHFSATVDDLAQIPHVHPTLAEIYTYLTDELDD